MIGRNDPCWCGSKQKWKQCHFPEENPHKPIDLSTLYKKHHIVLKSEEQIQGIRAAGHLAASILNATCAQAKEGITTLELNEFAHRLHLEAGAIPAPLNYGNPPFPKSICTSINEVICHGIPDKTVLKKGDILNIDVTALYKGYFGDCSRMVIIGDQTTPERQRVVDVSYNCLMRSIQILKPGISLALIGDTIQTYATTHQCSVVHQFVGHGTGIKFHEGPQIFHYRNTLDIPLSAGMVFTIEPMINAGVSEAILDPKDQWTARTADGKPSAQWEHTLLITQDGYEILTPWEKHDAK